MGEYKVSKPFPIFNRLTFKLQHLELCVTWIAWLPKIRSTDIDWGYLTSAAREMGSFDSVQSCRGTLCCVRQVCIFHSFYWCKLPQLDSSSTCSGKTRFVFFSYSCLELSAYIMRLDLWIFITYLFPSLSLFLSFPERERAKFIPGCITHLT